MEHLEVFEFCQWFASEVKGLLDGVYISDNKQYRVNLDKNCPTVIRVDHHRGVVQCSHDAKNISTIMLTHALLWCYQMIHYGYGREYYSRADIGVIRILKNYQPDINNKEFIMEFATLLSMTDVETNRERMKAMVKELSS